MTPPLPPAPAPAIHPHPYAASFHHGHFFPTPDWDFHNDRPAVKYRTAIKVQSGASFEAVEKGKKLGKRFAQV